MTTLTVHSPCVPQTNLDSVATVVVHEPARWGWIAIGTAMAIAALTVGLRVWAIGDIMATGDQVAEAYMVRHSYGIKWIFAQNYGPVSAVIHRTWQELVNRFNVPFSETIVRVPVTAASIIQVLVAFALLRRIKCSRGEAGLASLACAIMPTIVTEAHFTWGYLTFWLLAGTVALWATLAYFDTRRTAWLLLAAGCLIAHCLGNCFSIGLPITLLVAWWTRNRNGQPMKERIAGAGPGARFHARVGGTKKITGRMPVPHAYLYARVGGAAFVVGFALPCILSVATIVFCWYWTGQGILGRLLFKQSVGSSHPSAANFLHLPRMWADQFGYVFGPVAAIGLIYGTFRRGRPALLAWWCWASLVPLMFLVNWEQVGYPSAYLIEVAFTGGVLGALAAAAAYRRLAGHMAARIILAVAATLAFLHVGICSADACLGHGRLVRYTGVSAGSGSVWPEIGIKAAGWYVRRHVPLSAVIMCTHRNTGMEVPVAEYYLGRSVLADYDLSASQVEPLVRAMAPRVDVFILEPVDLALADSLAGFERVATFRSEGQAVRYIYARTNLKLPKIDAPTLEMNARYDRECEPRHVPQPILAAPHFNTVLAEYQSCLQRLRRASTE